MFNTRPLFAFARDAAEAGQRVVLVTLYAVEGTSSRNPGAHLVVREDGQYVGSLSDGCVESAIVSTALYVLAQGGPRELRLGKGSPFIDIRLPCGGTIDLLFNTLPTGLAASVINKIDARQPFRLSLPRGEGVPEVLAGGERFGLVLSPQSALVSHVPPLRLVILGHGPTIMCLAGLAGSLGIDCTLVTQDERLGADLRANGIAPMVLKGLASIPPITPDRWSACTLFFHDHDWEPALLVPILQSDACFIGAMGSRQTHRQRCARLADLGVPQHQIDRIAAPIGLIPSLRDPETLAISTLAQVMAAYNRCWLEG